MYTPAENRITDRNEILRFMREHPFATLVSMGSKGLVATSLPFVVIERDGEITLRCHMAKANPHWKEFESENGQDSLVIFLGPHAYISPTHYEHDQNVPTWNYSAAHAYGTVKLLKSIESRHEVIEETIDAIDSDYKHQYEHLHADYLDPLYKGIVAFELKVTRIEAKLKMSQNRTETERWNIIRDFETKEDARRDVATMMRSIETSS